MGLRRITGHQFPISPEEWHKRQIRIHELKKWAITILQIVGIVGFVILSLWIIEWLGV